MWHHGSIHHRKWKEESMHSAQYRHSRKTYHNLDLKDHEFYLINSNVKHSLQDSDYNNRRKECESALKSAS